MSIFDRFRHLGCRQDPRIKYFFVIDQARQENQKIKIVRNYAILDFPISLVPQAQVLIGLSGGTKRYDLERLQPFHFDMNITDFHFDAFLENLQVNGIVWDMK